MAIITYPLNGIEYTAENAETYLCTRHSGVFSADNHFSASVSDSREVTISAGLAWIQNTEYSGKSVYNDAPVKISIPVADGELPRIDRIVLKFDKASNASTIELKTGTPNSVPQPPEVTRTELVYELGLCTIDIPASSVSVDESNVKSTLLDESVCGIMRDGVTGIPTQDLYDQFSASSDKIIESAGRDLEDFKASYEAWFEKLQEELGDGAAYVGAVPLTRKINGYTLDNDVNLGITDIGITLTTDDLEAGVTPLENGKVVFVYEQ